MSAYSVSKIMTVLAVSAPGVYIYDTDLDNASVATTATDGLRLRHTNTSGLKHRPAVQGHRGAGFSAAPNSMDAMVLASELHLDSVEFDVGELFVFN